MVVALAGYSAVSNFAAPAFAAYGNAENSGENSASSDNGGDSGANVQQEGDFQGEN